MEVGRDDIVDSVVRLINGVGTSAPVFLMILFDSIPTLLAVQIILIMVLCPLPRRCLIRICA